MQSRRWPETVTVLYSPPDTGTRKYMELYLRISWIPHSLKDTAGCPRYVGQRMCDAVILWSHWYRWQRWWWWSRCLKDDVYGHSMRPSCHCPDCNNGFCLPCKFGWWRLRATDRMLRDQTWSYYGINWLLIEYLPSSIRIVCQVKLHKGLDALS